MSTHRYVLVTPVKDEERLIGETLASVISQSLLPIEWVIVDDGSTDRTADIIAGAATKHPWIRLLRRPPQPKRCFSAVVQATEAGVKKLRTDDYKYLGLLDGDLRLAPQYFESVVERFERNPALGLGGGHVVDLGKPVKPYPLNRKDVPGAVQFFRRACFEQLGGLFAIPEGGWDALTCLRARMLGYETQLFTDLVVDHLKPRNVHEGNPLWRNWQLGARDYALGYHPLFEVFKCISRITTKPLLVGAVCWLAGFFHATLEKKKRLIPNDLLRFSRQEQLGRIRQIMQVR